MGSARPRRPGRGHWGQWLDSLSLPDLPLQLRGEQTGEMPGEGWRDGGGLTSRRGPPTGKGRWTAGPEQLQCWSDSTHLCQGCGVHTPSPGTCAPGWAGRMVVLAMIERAAGPGSRRASRGGQARVHQAEGRLVLEVG